MIDTPKLDEVERKIAEGLTVSPREQYEAEREFLTIAANIRLKAVSRANSWWLKFDLIVGGLMSKIFLFCYTNNLVRDGLLRYFYLLHSQGKLKAHVAEMAFSSRTMYKELEGIVDAN